MPNPSATTPTTSCRAAQGYTSVDVGVYTKASPSTIKELKDAISWPWPNSIPALALKRAHISPLAFSRTEVPTFRQSWSAASTSSALTVRRPPASPCRLATFPTRGWPLVSCRPHELVSAFRLNTRLQVAALKGYTDEGLVVDLLLEPAQVLSEKLSAYLDLLITSNTSDLEDNLSVRLEPNLDIGLGDGMMLNAGVSVDLQGGDEQEDIGLFIVLLRDM